MDFDKKPEGAPKFNEEKKEGGEVEVTAKVELTEIIDAIKALDKDDQEKIYEALSDSLGKPMSGEPKKESEPKEPKDEKPLMDGQDLAKAFM